MKQKIFALTLVGLSIAVPFVALAQVTQPIPSVQPRIDITDVGTFLALLNRIVGYIFTILMIVAVIFILRAAFTYLTAGGDPARVGTAHNSLIYAAVAIAVGIVAYSVPLIVSSLLSR